MGRPTPLPDCLKRLHGGGGRVLRLAIAVGLAAAGWRALRGTDAPPLHIHGSPGRRPRVALFNGVNWHRENYAAHTYTLAAAAQPPLIDVYAAPGWDQGVGDLMRPWHRSPVRDAADFWPAACSYDLALFITATFDKFHPPINETAARAGLACPHGGTRPRIAVIVHAADLFATETARRHLAWLEPSYVLGTAPHNTELLRPFGRGRVDYLTTIYPLFPAGWNSTSRRGLGIVGQLDTTRRDYASVFRELETSPPPPGSPALPVRLLGSSGPPHANASIPPALLERGLVAFPGGGRRVPFGEYFSHFSAARALLPAFAPAAGYGLHTTSSVLFNSLVALAPLCIEAGVLRRFPFLDPRAHFAARDGSVRAAHEAMSGVGEEEYGAMLRRLAENRECLIRRNVAVVEAMLRGEDVGLPDGCGGEGEG